MIVVVFVNLTSFNCIENIKKFFLIETPTVDRYSPFLISYVGSLPSCLMRNLKVERDLAINSKECWLQTKQACDLCKFYMVLQLTSYGPHVTWDSYFVPHKFVGTLILV